MRQTLTSQIMGAFILCIVGIFVTCWGISPEPETCALCGGRTYHAPCVMELSTGTLTELAIYAPDPLHLEELAGEQDMDHHVFRMAGSVAMTVERTPERQRCAAYIPLSRKSMDRKLFCGSCRKLLAETRQRGFVLLDLRDTADITAYPIAPGAVYLIRDYTVSAAEREGGYTVEVSAALFQAAPE